VEEKIMALKHGKNLVYLIDIITLLLSIDLTNPPLSVYAVEYVHPGADAEHSNGTTLLAHGRTR
jgi:hypothetical protein